MWPSESLRVFVYAVARSRRRLGDATSRRWRVGEIYGSPLRSTPPPRHRRDLRERRGSFATASFARRVLAGDDVGTYFSNDIARKPSLDEGNPLEAVGQSARRAARALQALEADDRTKILKAIASKLRAAAPAILAANAADVADSGDVAQELRQRLGLSAAKLETVAKGVEALANAKDPVSLRRPFLLHLRRRSGSRRHRRDTHRSMKHRSGSC